MIARAINLRKNFINPDGIKVTYANEAVISSDQNEFFLTFYQLEPPMVLTEQEKAELKENDPVDAVAVVKIAINPAFAKSLLKALKGQIETREAAKKLNLASQAEATDG